MKIPILVTKPITLKWLKTPNSDELEPNEKESSIYLQLMLQVLIEVTKMPKVKSA